ncbi:MAG: response regulator transcription factor [Ignavibacteriaceae bacterium]|nr:LytTR family DNA-binding domain-containing protein [Ignavibacteriaceae bacterium]NUM70452.1 response regulator transcription factor [Ignavibacteriaceae bacterium]
MKCIIIDDENVSRMLLSELVKKEPFLELAGTFDNAVEVIDFIKTNQVDLIFLDIEMPELTGFEFLKIVKNPPKIVLTTSNPEYALTAFDFDVADYLLKPITLPRFLRAVDKIKQIESGNTSAAYEDSIFLKEEGKFVKVEVRKILFIEAQGDYMKVNIEGGKKLLILSTMKSIENKLPQKHFLRVHRSFIVNINKISDLTENNLLIEKNIIPVGNSYRETLMKNLNIL